jgi:hypothetical protein
VSLEAWKIKNFLNVTFTTFQERSTRKAGRSYKEKQSFHPGEGGPYFFFCRGISGVSGQYPALPLKKAPSQELIAHACHPSYLGGRGHSDWVETSSRQIVHKLLAQKNPPQNRAGGVAQGPA